MFRRTATAVVTLFFGVSLLSAPPSHADTPGPSAQMPTTAPPAGLKVTNHTATSVTVSWYPVSGAAGYRLIIAASASMSNAVGTTTTALSHTFRQLHPKTTYYIAVGTIAPGNIIATKYSAPIKVKTSALGAIGPPKVSWAGHTELTVRWKAVAEATHYQVQVSASASMQKAFTITATKTKVTTVGPRLATTYYVRVRATMIAGSHPGPWSPTVKTATFRAKPGKPHHKVKITGGSSAQRKAVKSYLKKWGKYTHITSVTLKRNSGRAGVAWMNFGTGQARIVLRNTLTGKKLRQVAAHEIAHAKTAWIYQMLDLDTIKKSLSKRFGKAAGTNGAFETMADCLTQHKTGSKSHLYYKSGGCTKTQLSWAAKITKGHRI